MPELGLLRRRDDHAAASQAEQAVGLIQHLIGTLKPRGPRDEKGGRTQIRSDQHADIIVLMLFVAHLDQFTLSLENALVIDDNYLRYMATVHFRTRPRKAQ